MKQSYLEMIIYTLIAIGICLLLGTTLTQAKSSAIEEQPIATPESYFDDSYIEPPYNPCKDFHLKYERGLESRQRQQQCEVKQ